MFLTSNPSFPMAGIVAVASAALFAIRYVRPEASREYDLVFSVMGLIYALCLFLEGWRLIPLMFFAQVLVIAFGGFFAFESFRLRIQLVEKSRQASGGSPRREGFTRTYRPANGDLGGGRVVSSRPGDSPRMRRVVDADRTFESRETRRRPANRQPPRLAPASSDPDGSDPRPKRPRPAQDSREDYRDPGPRARNQNREVESTDRPPDRPARRDPQSNRPSEGRVDRRRPPEDFEPEYGPDFSDDYPEAPKPRRPRPPVIEADADVLPPSNRRRPPQLPDDDNGLEDRGLEDRRRASDRVIEVDPVDVEAVEEDDSYSSYSGYDDYDQ